MRFHREYSIEEQSGFQAEKRQKFLGYQSTEVLNFGLYRMAYRIFHLTNFLSLQIKGQACPQFFWISFWTIFLFLRLLAISVDVTETGRCLSVIGWKWMQQLSHHFKHSFETSQGSSSLWHRLSLSHYISEQVLVHILSPYSTTQHFYFQVGSSKSSSKMRVS